VNVNSFDILPPELAAERRKKIDEVFRSGQRLFFEDEQNGHYFRHSLYPIPDTVGKITKLYIIAQDITEQKLAEKENRELQLFSNAVVGSIPGPFYMLDAEDRFVKWNAYERDVVLGKSEIEMPDTFALQSVHPDDRVHAAKKISKVMETDSEVTEELRILIHGGPGFCWHQLTAKRIVINNTPFLIGTAIEITYRKNAQDDALRQSEDRFRRLFEEHSAIKLVIEPETGAILDANKAATRYYGWSADELRRMNIREITMFSPDEGKPVIENAGVSANDDFIVKHRRADGSVRIVEVQTNRIKVEGKDLLSSIIQDITQRKLAEEERKKLSTIIQQSPSAIFVTDPDGNIEYINPSFSMYTGYNFEDVKGKNPRILQSGLMPKSIYEELWKTILSGNVWSGEFQNKRINGELYWENALISPNLDEKGVITNFAAIIEDITEKKKFLGELVAAKEKAEESERLKTAFLAKIGHEIRTPMNGIIGLSDLLLEPPLAEEEQRLYIELIQQSGQRMLKLINDIIDFSLIEAGEKAPQITPTRVNDLLRELYNFFNPEADRKELRLSCTTGLSDEKSVIETDSLKLHQILANLVHNALIFTVHGGIDIGYSKRGELLDFYVTDSGKGIPADMNRKIFERFRQADDSLTRAYEGAGLGLSISKAYAEMLGGAIDVESEEGIGSRFTVIIPYNPPGSHKTDLLSASKHEPLGMISGITILIAEDDEVSSMLLKKNLKNENIEILTAANSQEAVELVKSRPGIDIVLMDIKMPVMNGLEAVVQIKKFRPELPVIAQTAFTSKEYMKKAQIAGFDSFLTKPVDKNNLLEMMRLLLKK
jgi:PAS domain S-box-containing protein